MYCVVMLRHILIAMLNIIYVEYRTFIVLLTESCYTECHFSECQKVSVKYTDRHILIEADPILDFIFHRCPIFQGGHFIQGN
jgi:hypothetical protein